MNKKLLRVAGLIYLITSYIVMFYLFINAFRDPRKGTIVLINEFGEANIELVVLIIGAFFVIWFVYDFFKTKAYTKPQKHL
jgi:hypothetical protein